MIQRCHALHRKPLLVLTEEEVELALRQRVGLSWLRVVALQRLRADPLREELAGLPGDMLRNALEVGKTDWGDLASELEQIASALTPTPPHDDHHAPLHEAWSQFKRN